MSADNVTPIRPPVPPSVRRPKLHGVTAENLMITSPK
jgi:hypothetical protein